MRLGSAAAIGISAASALVGIFATPAMGGGERPWIFAVVLFAAEMMLASAGVSALGGASSLSLARPERRYARQPVDSFLKANTFRRASRKASPIVAGADLPTPSVPSGLRSPKARA